MKYFLKHQQKTMKNASKRYNSQEVSMSNAELKEILQRIVNNDQSAFTDLYNNYSKVIFGIALSVLKNEENCYDVIQLVMSKLYTMPKERFPTSHELTWLYIVTKNEALQLIRKEHLHIPLDDIIDLASGTDELSQAMDMDIYRTMIKSLDEQSKAIVTLKVIAGFSHKEIGGLLHIPTGTVQWKYHLAVHKLRIALANFVLFVIFGLADVVYFFTKPVDIWTEGGTPGIPSLIDRVMGIDCITITLAIFTLFTLTISMIFYIKSPKKPTK